MDQMTCKHCGGTYDRSRAFFLPSKAGNITPGALCRKCNAAKQYKRRHGTLEGWRYRPQTQISDEAARSKRPANMWLKLGVTRDDYAAMSAEQNDLCAICQRPESCPVDRRYPDLGARRLAVDHCHTTGRVRALLCSACNLALGKMEDDKARLAAAIAYLDKYGTS
jgi:hypothetical protein